jgi:hypothetical protein
MRARRPWRRAVAAACLLAGASAAGQEKKPPADVTSFAVFALSRGKGVPEAAREALRKVAELAEADKHRGIRVETRRTRIGLEGETKLCVEYEAAADAGRALEQAEKIVKDVELVNLVPGPCSGKARPDEKGEKP